jgi:hypothetical protein
MIPKDATGSAACLEKVTLSLERSQVARLDRISIELRVSSGVVVTRGELVRLIIDLAIPENLDNAGIFTLEDVTRAIQKHLISKSVAVVPDGYPAEGETK